MSCCCVVRLERQVPCWPRRAVLRALRPARRSAVRAVPNKGAGAGAARYSEEHALSVWKGPETSISESHPAPPLAEGRRRYPLTAVVGNAAAKTALLVAAVCPSLSVLLMGRRGTAKTVLARGMHQLLPPLRVVRGSWSNADPDRPGEWETGLAPNPHVDIRPCPLVGVPLGATEDRVVGAIDVEASVRQGRPSLQPGLLAEAHRGVLCLDEVNLLDEGIAHLVLSAVDAGGSRVEREGLSAWHPCAPLLVATMNPEEGPLPETLLDRFAMIVEAETLTGEDRVLAEEAAEWAGDEPAGFQEAFQEAEGELAARIAAGRLLMEEGAVTVSREQVAYLARECTGALCEGNRVEVYAARAAQAHAALHGRTAVAAPDLRAAIELVVMPRARAVPRAPPPPPQDQEHEEEGEESEKSESGSGDEQSEEEKEEEEELPVPSGMVFAPEAVDDAADLMAAARAVMQAWGRGGRTKKDTVVSRVRGRYVKAEIPKGPDFRLAVDATLRAAAPHQRWRRAHRGDAWAAELGRLPTAAPGEEGGQAGALWRAAARRAKQPQRPLKVLVDKDDVRSKRLMHREGQLAVLVVDASGSMALNRMGAAKGAALRILDESYRRRAQVALVAAWGTRAQVLLPPTRALARAQARLRELPCGGGTPLAHAVKAAAQVAATARARGEVSRVSALLLTDGRANIPLRVSEEGPPVQAAAPLTLGQSTPRVVVEESKEAMAEEVCVLAQSLVRSHVDLTVIDTSGSFAIPDAARPAAALAARCGCRYLHLPIGTRRGDEALETALHAVVAQ